MKGGRLPSLMRHILNLLAPAVVIAFAAFFLSGCSEILGDERQEADDAVTEANGAIAEHNRLFDQARESYAVARENIESGDDPADQRERITEARETLEEARRSLEDASTRIEDVRGLDVDPAIKDYARLLSEAMDAQLSAEAREIEFYEILEEDPALTDNRDQALDLLSEAGDGYARAEEYYAEARDLAESNPNVIKLPPAASGAENSVPEETTLDAPENQQETTGE